MKIAIPLADGRLAVHFGHCQHFALLDVDRAAGSIQGSQLVQAPEHAPGLLPKWLAERGVEVIIAGGMGARAQTLFEQMGIKAVTGAPAQEPEQIVQSYLDGTLEPGQNLCDH